MRVDRELFLKIMEAVAKDVGCVGIEDNSLHAQNDGESYIFCYTNNDSDIAGIDKYNKQTYIDLSVNCQVLYGLFNQNYIDGYMYVELHFELLGNKFTKKFSDAVNSVKEKCEIKADKSKYSIFKTLFGRKGDCHSVVFRHNDIIHIESVTDEAEMKRMVQERLYDLFLDFDEIVIPILKPYGIEGRDRNIDPLFRISKIKHNNTGSKLSYKRESHSMLSSYFARRGFYFSENYINSFYLSLKTKGFVILAGLSGTGKTKIWEKFVSLFRDGTSLFVPVKPDFRDSKSLLGYYNPLEKKYEATPLLSLIMEAQKDYAKNGADAEPYFVLFDEMNLARVEYYFADFLSVMETAKIEEGAPVPADLTAQYGDSAHYTGFSSQGIILHSQDDELKCGSYTIPRRLYLPPNVYFTGSVNVDETTHVFSPKVLDRAFVVESDMPDFDSYAEHVANSNGEADDIDVEKIKRDLTHDGGFIGKEKSVIFEFLKSNDNVMENLKQYNSALKDSGFEFGYRVFDEIVLFLAESSAMEEIVEIDETTAFDLAVKMKVLPKIHGTKQKILERLGRLGDIAAQNGHDETKKKIDSMIGRCTIDGFAGFM